MKKALIALLLVLALPLAGCAKEPVQEELSPPEPPVSTTPVSTPTEFSLPYSPAASLHPITGTSHPNRVLASLVYQGLFELDNTFTAHGVLCSDTSVSVDGLTWTLTLSDAVFSDGSPVTAADVATSLELARSSKLYSRRLSTLRQITANGDGTVTILLSQPNGSLPNLLDTPIIRDKGDGSMPLGTGPYAFVEDDGPLRLARQASAPETAPREIALRPIEGADELIYAFDAGNVSLVVSDLTGTNALGFSSGYEVFRYPTTTMLYVGFQTASGPCRDALIRQAISRSFDRETVTNSLLAGHAAATCLPFSPYSTLYHKGYEEPLAYDPAAVELLRAAGCTTGENGQLYLGRTTLSLTFVVNTDNSFKLSIAEYLAEQLTELGISVDLQKLSWEDYIAALERGNFDLYLGEVTLTADFDLSPLLSQSGALNYGRYTNPETDALLIQLQAANKPDLAQISDAFLEQFQADMPIAPLCFKNHAVLTRWGSISGLTPTRQNPFYHLESLRFDAVR